MKMPNVTKLLNNKTLQTGAGLYLYYDQIAKNYGGSGMDEILDKINKAISNPHFPDLNAFMSELRYGTLNAQLMQYLKLYLVGYGLKAVGVGAKWGTVAQNFSKNAAKGAVLASLIGFSTSWNSPIPGDAPTTTQNNFLRAPQASSYGDY